MELHARTWKNYTTLNFLGCSWGGHGRCVLSVRGRPRNPPLGAGLIARRTLSDLDLHSRRSASLTGINFLIMKDECFRIISGIRMRNVLVRSRSGFSLLRLPCQVTVRATKTPFYQVQLIAILTDVPFLLPRRQGKT